MTACFARACPLLMEKCVDTCATSWETKRELVRQRDGLQCVSCEEALGHDADVHHILPRSMGGTDEISNLVTLCDGCHASHHPNLAGGLAQRTLERWAVLLARWLDREGTLVEASGNFGAALRLFGVQHFRNGQLPIVLAALAGRSVLVVSPTGSGKTLCFQLPAVLRHGLSIVVCPLKTLMSEQVSDLLRKKIPATFINSDLGRQEKETRLSLLSQQAFKLLYLAPERFFVRNEGERIQLRQSRPSYLVVDEAHCVDQWGQDFRPEYGRLKDIRQELGSPPVLAFTATAGKEMQDRILTSLGISDARVFVRDVDRPNIAMMRWRSRADDRSARTAELLALPQLAGQKAMIFVPSVRIGEALQEKLGSAGFDIPFYHSSVASAWEREQLVKRFMGQSLPVVDKIICTNAFGMGLDVPNIRLVVHWQQSASTEDLLQEFGRAGRDGKPSLSVIFHDGKAGRDVSLLKFMAEKSAESASLIDDERARILHRRFHHIDQAATMLRSQRCFRLLVKEYFGDTTSSKRMPLSERILNWVFSASSAKSRHQACCDYCDAKVIADRGPLAYAARTITK